MILIKLICLWFVTGLLVQALEILRIANMAHKYGAKFKLEFDFKCTIHDAIMWPNFIRMVNDVIDRIEREHSDDKLS